MKFTDSIASFCSLLILVTINFSSAQTDIKPYVKKLDGTVTYHSEIKNKVPYKGIDGDIKTRYKPTDLSSVTYNVKASDDEFPFEQKISLRIGKKIKTDDKKALDKHSVDRTVGGVQYFVYFVQGDTMIVRNLEAPSGGALDNPSGVNSETDKMAHHGANTVFLIIGDEATAISAYLSKKKNDLGFDLLINTFSDERLTTILSSLKEVKIMQLKKYENKWNEVRQLYFKDYYVEL